MSLAVVHLARKANGLEPLRAFLESYHSVPTGAAHDLVLLLKGFASKRDASDHLALAGDAAAATLLVPDVGFDVGAYFAAAERIEHRYVCFVNSFTTPRAPGWLGMLLAALDLAGAGLVGATGSYASHWSWLCYEAGLPSEYSNVYPTRAGATAEMFRFAQLQGNLDRVPRQPKRWLGAMRAVPFFLRNFDRFPACHVRTNGFLLETALMRSLQRDQVRTKFDAFKVEGGKSSLTKQVQALGLETFVVGADGAAYPPAHWPESRTFWQGDQENLLVEDNQTLVYASVDMKLRTLLARFAWGDAADPAPPSTIRREPAAAG